MRPRDLTVFAVFAPHSEPFHIGIVLSIGASNAVNLGKGIIL